MKLKLYTAAAFAAIVTLASCAGDNNKDYVDKTIMPTAEEKAASAQNAAVTTTVPAATTNVMPANLQAPVNTVTVPGTTTPTMVMQPNQQQMQQMTAGQQNNVVMTPVQTPAPTVTQPGMNPAHGQPNHRCDIAVGAPLNSKPAPAPAVTQPTAVNAQPQVTMKEVPNTTKTAPGMNPPHGEPNHRCDIAVGAPLNSKPAPTTVTTAPPALITAPKTDSSKN